MDIFLMAMLFFAERLLPWRSRELKFFSPAYERAMGLGFFLFTQLILRFVAYGPFMYLVVLAGHSPVRPPITWTQFAFQFAVTVFFEELVIYAEHYLKHKIPFLWRMHAMHHCAEELDGLVSFRRHPLEIAMNLTLNWLLVFTLSYCFHFSFGPVFMALAVGAFYNFVVHSNLNFRKMLGPRLSGWYEKVLFTPDTHSAHHVGRYFQNNFGRGLVIFDHLFRTYCGYRVQPGDKFGFQGADYFPRPLVEQLFYFLHSPSDAGDPRN